VLYPGPPGSPTGTLYEVVGEEDSVQHQDSVQHLGDDLYPIRSVRKGSKTPGTVSGTPGSVSGTPGTVSGPPGSGTPRAEGASDSEDEIAPSPNMKRVLTRLQRALEAGGSSAANSLGSHMKEGAAQKKHRSS